MSRGVLRSEAPWVTWLARKLVGTIEPIVGSTSARAERSVECLTRRRESHAHCLEEAWQGPSVAYGRVSLKLVSRSSTTCSCQAFLGMEPRWFSSCRASHPGSTERERTFSRGRYGHGGRFPSPSAPRSTARPAVRRSSGPRSSWPRRTTAPRLHRRLRPPRASSPSRRISEPPCAGYWRSTRPSTGAIRRGPRIRGYRSSRSSKRERFSSSYACVLAPVEPS